MNFKPKDGGKERHWGWKEVREMSFVKIWACCVDVEYEGCLVGLDHQQSIYQFLYAFPLNEVFD